MLYEKHSACVLLLTNLTEEEGVSSTWKLASVYFGGLDR